MASDAVLRRIGRIGGQGDDDRLVSIPASQVGDLTITKGFADDAHHLVFPTAISESGQLRGDVDRRFAADMRSDRDAGDAVQPMAGTAEPGGFAPGRRIASGDINLRRRRDGEDQLDRQNNGQQQNTMEPGGPKPAGFQVTDQLPL